MADDTTTTRWADRHEDYEFWAQTRKTSAQKLKEAIEIFRQINQSLHDLDKDRQLRTGSVGC